MGVIEGVGEREGGERGEKKERGQRETGEGESCFDA